MIFGQKCTKKGERGVNPIWHYSKNASQLLWMVVYWVGYLAGTWKGFLKYKKIYHHHHHHDNRNDHYQGSWSWPTLGLPGPSPSPATPILTRLSHSGEWHHALHCDQDDHHGGQTGHGCLWWKKWIKCVDLLRFVFFWNVCEIFPFHLDRSDWSFLDNLPTPSSLFCSSNIWKGILGI